MLAGAGVHGPPYKIAPEVFSLATQVLGNPSPLKVKTRGKLKCGQMFSACSVSRALPLASETGGGCRVVLSQNMVLQLVSKDDKAANSRRAIHAIL